MASSALSWSWAGIRVLWATREMGDGLSLLLAGAPGCGTARGGSRQGPVQPEGWAP